jgi:hypothetical protein
MCHCCMHQQRFLGEHLEYPIQMSVFYEALQRYLLDSLMERKSITKADADQMRIVGHLLLCGVPDWYCNKSLQNTELT